MLKVAVGMLSQETNVFNPSPTTIEHFETSGILFGDEVFKRWRNAGEIGGFMKASEEEADVLLVPTMSATAMPWGKCDKETHRFLKETFLEELRKAGEIDGILLAMHGAMSAEDEYDVEGDLLDAIRKEWGEDVLIAVSLDHHGNITKRIVESVNVLVGYHTEPHIDMFETGYKTAKILFSALKGSTKPVIAWRKLPMISSGDLRVPGGPLEEFFREAEEYERLKEIISVSIFPENPYIDSPELGWSVVVVADGNRSLAQKIADNLAKKIWEKRNLFLPKREASPREAVERALKVEGGPVVLSDWSDATNSGAPGDGTAILRELLKHNDELSGKALITVTDPEAVNEAIKAGIGSEITVEVGGKIDRTHSRPVKVTGRVKTISDGRFIVKGPMEKNFEANMKRTVVLEVKNIYIVVSESTGPAHDPSLYRNVGLEPRDAKIVVVKSPMGFRAAYEPFAKEIIIVHGPGAATPDLKSLNYRMIPRPMFPLDEDVEFEL